MTTTTTDHFETVVLGDPASPTSRFEMVTGRENLERKLVDRFPEEKEAIHKFLQLRHETSAAWKGAVLLKSLPLGLAKFLYHTGLYRWIDGGYHKLATKTVQQGLEELTDNPDLRAILSYNFGDYGVEPSQAPFLLQPTIVHHYLHGAYYPHGGPSVIPQKIIRKIHHHGGQVLVSAPVKRIVVENSRGICQKSKAKGIELHDGTTVLANAIVSDVGIVNTATKLLPSDLLKLDFVGTEQESDNVHKLRLSETGVALFVGLKGDHKELNLPHYQLWIHPSRDFDADAERLRKMSLDDALELDSDQFSLFVGFPCTKDKAWTADYPNKSTLEILVGGSSWSWFEKFASTWDETSGSHGAEYEEVKKKLADKIWSRVGGLFCIWVASSCFISHFSL